MKECEEKKITDDGRPFDYDEYFDRRYGLPASPEEYSDDWEDAWQPPDRPDRIGADPDFVKSSLRHMVQTVRLAQREEYRQWQLGVGIRKKWIADLGKETFDRMIYPEEYGEEPELFE